MLAFSLFLRCHEPPIIIAARPAMNWSLASSPAQVTTDFDTDPSCISPARNFSVATFCGELSVTKSPPFDQMKGDAWNVPSSVATAGKARP